MCLFYIEAAIRRVVCRPRVRDTDLGGSKAAKAHHGLHSSFIVVAFVFLHRRLCSFRSIASRCSILTSTTGIFRACSAHPVAFYGSAVICTVVWTSLIVSWVFTSAVIVISASGRVIVPGSSVVSVVSA